MQDLKQSERIEQDSDEISLFDLVEAARKGWKWLVIPALCCGCLGLLYARTLSVSYEATANVLLACVADAPVETPGFLAKKLTLPGYFSEQTIQACAVSTGQELARRLKASDTLSVKPESAIALRYKANTPEHAKACLHAVLSDIHSAQKGPAGKSAET